MRWVVDPGVLIAAAISPGGVCRQLLRRWVDGDFELVVSGDPDLTDLAAPDPPVLTPRAALRALDRRA